MQLTGTFSDGIVIPDQSTAIPDGTKVRILIVEIPNSPAPTFEERLAKLKSAANNQPTDLAQKHDQSSLGTSKG